MALVTLANGKTIDVDIMWFLSLSDNEYQDLIASNSGCEINNPFHGSCLARKGAESWEEVDDEEEVKPLTELRDVEIEERDDV